MRNPVPIVLLALVALSLPISAAGTTGWTAVQDGNDGVTTVDRPSVTTDGDHAQLDGTPNRLVLENDRRTAYATPSLDFGLTLASQDESIRTDHRTFALESRLDELGDDEARRDAIVAELERIEDRTSDLRERERNAVTAHAAGEIGEDAVLRTLAKNSHEAQELQRALNDLDDQSSGIVDVSDSVDALSAGLEVYRGPIRTKIDSTLRGTDESDGSTETKTPISVETGGNGLVLSTINGNEYLREATRYDNRALGRSDQIRTMDDAREIAQELYPWAFETTSGTYTIKHGAVQLYQVQAMSHDQGQLTVYLDGGSGTVYHERQTLNVDRLPTVKTDTMEGENLNVTLEQTSGATPAKLTVTDAKGETPVDATVVVDGTVVSETDDTGQLWFVPPTDGFDLRVRTASESLNAAVTSR